MAEPTPLGLALGKVKIDEEAIVADLASSGFLRAYVGWAARQTDAPKLFHVGAALCTLSAGLGNRVRFRTWGADVFPNLWMCLLAPSGFYRKSTAMRMPVKMLAEADPACLLPQDFSREKLVAHLGQRPEGLLVAPEFGELLAKLTRDYMAGTKEMLTALFDGENYERVTQKERSRVKDPSITILTASTEDWIGDRVTAGDLRGGFLSRFLFLPAREKGPRKGIGDGIDDGARAELAAAVGGRTRVAGVADFSKVKKRLDDWIYEFEEGVNQAPDPRLMGFYSRAGTYVQKLAVCFQVAEPEPGLMISGECAEKAIRMWEYLSANVREVVTQRIATTRTEKQIRVVMEAIERVGTIDHTELLRQTNLLSRELEPVLATLIESARVLQMTEKTRGRPLRRYRLSSQTGWEESREVCPPALALPENHNESGMHETGQ